ncbi:glycosyltransferase family 2 protein [Paenibacillus chitinolyticus]|uniref:Glycosyltransferase n=1 Tax=Paenibacillus chitinolyticus TaxID=79263 RepID=A0A410WRQ5_9BACL|nr:glycosyltransferase family 2 protein [Paenibacillus chitinolyticus]MCY9593881.1 glycosyltransferase [Paenibacillus chitinolyticus]MCY9598803.1 glycosyltransferase [Paenibacillus chitinolyticus]QAV17012.1 glycosyltransferase family 2 protein [Paenibacillus chitinolyticus]
MRESQSPKTPKEPLISAVVPTYNRPYVLGELLETLAAQNYPNLEVLVVNDAGVSVDFVAEAFPELAVTVINQPVNLKHVHARNEALRRARGELILLCDDDDLLTPGHIRRMLAALEETGADFAYSDVELFDYRVEGRTRIPVSRRLFAYEFDLAEMRKFSTYVPSGTLYRRCIHDTLGEYDPEVHHYWDWDFFLRTAGSYKIVRVPVASVLYAFSLKGDNVSGNRQEGNPYLGRLCAKHGLGELPSENFFTLLDKPHMRQREASSTIIWDGEPVVSRLAEQAESV